MKKYVSGVALLLAVLLLTVSAYAANDMLLFGPQVKKMDSGKVNKEVDLNKETSGNVSVHQKAGGKGTVEDSKKTSDKILLNGEKVNVTEVSTFNVKKLIQSQSPQSAGMEATYSINDTLAADELGVYGDASGNPWSLTRGETVEISLSWLPSDTGPGIPKEALPHIFEPFYRMDDARSKNKTGSGLGLTIASSILSKHGGSIRVERMEPYRDPLPTYRIRDLPNALR